MAVKIRLARRGRKKRPYYHIIIADARAPRDGKFIEQIGAYNPMTKPATIELDREKAYEWMEKGAQPTDTVRAILRFKGVLYKKHLQRGVAKGALSQEDADTKLASWIEAKESKVAARVEETRKELEEFRKMVSGESKPKVKAPVDDTAADAFREDLDTPAEDAPAADVAEAPEAEAPAADVAEAPAAEAPEAEAVELAPAAEDAPAADVAEAPEAEAVEMAPAAEDAPAADVAEAPEAEAVEMAPAAEDAPAADVAEAEAEATPEAEVVEAAPAAEVAEDAPAAEASEDAPEAEGDPAVENAPTKD